MSTELRTSSERGARAERRLAHRFRITLRVAVCVLVVLVGGLTFAGALQGPRLKSASINTATATERPSQRLVLATDQAIASVTASQVTVTPAASVEVSSKGTAITIRFAQALRAATSYHVKVSGVTGATTGVSAQLDYKFTTPDLTVYSLLRRPAQDGGTKEPDEIRRGAVGGDSGEIVFSAPRIQEYVVLPAGLAVVTLDDENDGTLVYAPAGESDTQPITLPGLGTIRNLGSSSGSSGMLAFTFTADVGPGDDPLAAEFDTLYVADPSDGTGLARPVQSLDGTTLAAMDLTWVPDTTSLVAHAIDTSLFLVDALGVQPPTPLGQHAELRGIIPGTTQLVVADPLQGSIIDLATGETTILDLPQDGLTDDQYPQQLLLLGEDSYAEVVASISSDNLDFSFSVVLATPASNEVVYEPADDGTVIRRICVSPNGQYLAVEVGASDAAPDLYPNVAGYLGASTYFVDLTTGSTNQGLTGFAVDWCN